MFARSNILLLLLLLLVAIITDLLLANPFSSPFQIDFGKDSPLSFALRVIGLNINSAASRITPQQEIKVIGAGFPRTGTRSTKAALERLGYKVLHMEDFQSLGLSRELNRALMYNNEYYLDLFLDKILSLGFNATLDCPGQFLSFDLARKFPRAKVLLTERDTPGQWAESFRTLHTTFRFSYARPLVWFVDQDWWAIGQIARFGFREVPMFCKSGFASWLWWYDCIEDRIVEQLPEHANRTLEQAYLDWNARVLGEIPSQRVLRFNVKQGWAPLVQFLGGKAEEGLGPFPHFNEAASIQRIAQMFHFLTIVYPVFILAALYLGAKLVLRVAAVFGL